MFWCRAIDLIKLFMCVIPAVAGVASATDYFVDSESGRDDYSGTLAQAGNGGGPWRTLNRIVSASIQPGDRILLKCGGVWDSAVVLELKGTSDSPIVLTGYGDCTGRLPVLKPVSVSLLPEYFRKESVGWSAALSEPPGMVVHNGEVLSRARFPAKGWLKLTGINDAVRATPSDFPVALTALTGADLIVRTNDYSVEARRLYGIGSEGQLLVAKPFEFKPVVGAGYYLEGQQWMLESSGGWAYDQVGRRIYLRQRPSGPVDVSNSHVALGLDQSEYVRIQGVAIRFVTGVALDIVGGRNVELIDLDIADVGLAFVRARDSDNVLVKNLRARRSQHDGVVVHKSAGVAVMDSLIEDVGVSDNLRKSVAAIQVDSSSPATVTNNRIFRTGYSSIMFGKNSVVSGNVVTQSCMRLIDCGAIYTSGARKKYGHYNSRVFNNLISEVLGNLDGVERSAAITAGIYLDDESRGIEVSGNFVEKTQRGIFSKATASSITGNSLYDNIYGVRLDPTGAYGDGDLATKVEDNFIVSKFGQMPFLINSDMRWKPVSLQNNRVRGVAGALPSQLWSGASKRPNSGVENVQIIGRSLSLVNVSEVRQSYSCPFQKADCTKVRLPDGSSVRWPLHLMPGEAVILSEPEQL